MAWINVRDRLPEQKQLVWYFSPILGLWRGVYERRVPEYLISEDENGNTVRVPIDERTKNCINPEEFSSGGGNCDTDEVTHWQPYDEQRAQTGWVPLPPMFVIPPMDALRQHNRQRAATPLESVKDLVWHIRDLANENADLDADIDDQAPKDMNQWRGGVIVQLCDSALQKIKTQLETDPA
jgi:hypothetical protein